MNIITSINPFDRLDIQMESLSTWKNKGCKIYSVNSSREIDILKKYSYKGQYIVDEYFLAKETISNKYVKMEDVMKNIFHNNQNEIWAIVNSDIAIDNLDLSNILNNVDKTTVIVGTRHDKYINNRYEYFKYGYDVFIFDPNALLNINFSNSIFGLGLPWWDYWFPILLHINGLKFKHIDDIHFIHQYHNTRYDHKVWVDIGESFRTIFAPVFDDKDLINEPIYDYCTRVKKYIDECFKNKLKFK